MTIEQLLNKSADELEKMTEAELQGYFEPYLKFTRPDLAEKPKPNGTVRRIEHRQIKNKDIVSGILGSLGLDLDDLRK